MKISIPKQEIEKFLSLCSYVDVTNDSVSYSPITEYILVEIKRGFCKMTLTSQSSFISYMFSISEQTTETFLISYLNLKKFYSNNKKEFLIITDSEKTISFSDGIFTSKYSKNPEISIELFPSIPSLSGIDSIKISKNLINQLVISKKYILPENKDKLRPILNLSTIKGKLLLSSDSFISCLFNLEENFDFTMFSTREINLVENFEYFDYLKTNNWNIIKYKTIIFGNRIREDIHPGQLHETIDNYIKIIDKSKKMMINVDQFYDFCKSIKSFVKDENVNSYLTVIDNSKIQLSYDDIQNSIHANQIVDCNLIGYENGYKICFVQSSIIKVLDSLKSDFINLSECIEDNGRKQYIGFWLESDANFHSICSKGFELPSEEKIQSQSI